MDKQKQKEIYNKWKQLEAECHIEAREVIRGKPCKINIVVPEKMNELNKYKRWIDAYCMDLLDASEKFEILSDVDENKIQCKCYNPDCAKCLLINCQDDDCYFHPIEKKKIFRLSYKNR